MTDAMLTEERRDAIRLTPNDCPGSLTPERLAALLDYCKLTELADDPEVQTLIPLFFSAAEGYLEQAGISPPAEGTARRAQYDLCINYLVLNSWEDREAAYVGTGSSVHADNPVFRRIVNQMKRTENS